MVATKSALRYGFKRFSQRRIEPVPQIGKLEPVPLRELWQHEERGFSVWLESNLDRLSDSIGISLSDPQRESLAGNFQVDLVAEDEGGGRVIIENQLEATDQRR